MNFTLTITSFGLGLIVGLTSIGAASLLGPFLILVLGVRPVTAVGTDLIYGVITRSVGAWVHWKQQTVDLQMVRRLAKGSIPGGVLGSLVAVLLPRFTHDTGDWVRSAMGAVLVIVSLLLLVPAAALFSRQTIAPRFQALLLEKGPVVWGAVAGFAVGTTSIGSGSLIAPFLMLVYSAGTSKVVGTSVFHGALLVLVTGSIHAVSGEVEWNLLPSLLAGSVPGVWMGSRLAPLVPARPLRFVLAALLLWTGFRMI